MSPDTQLLAERLKRAAAPPRERLDRRALQQRLARARRRRTTGYVAAVLAVLAVGAVTVPLLVPGGETTVLLPGPQPVEAPDDDVGQDADEGLADRPVVPAPPLIDDDEPREGPHEPDAQPRDTPPVTDDDEDPAGQPGPGQDDAHPPSEKGTPEPPAASSNLSAQITLERTTVLPNERVQFSVLNDGDASFSYDSRYRIERQTSQGWEWAGPPEPSAWQDWLRSLDPGHRDSNLSIITNGLTPGSYRLVKDFEEFRTGDGPTRRFEAYAHFTVITAPND